MGGYGAVALALQYPDVFRAAASHSGVVSPTYVGPHPFDGIPRYATSDSALQASWGDRFWPLISPAFGTDSAAWFARGPTRRVQRMAAAGARDERLGAIADHQFVISPDGLVGKQRPKTGARRQVGGEGLDEPLPMAALHHDQRAVRIGDRRRRARRDEREGRKAPHRQAPAERERARRRDADPHPREAARTAADRDRCRAAAID